MENSTDDFADRIYLFIELQCDACQRRFDQPDEVGGTEADVRRWANETAAAALKLVGEQLQTGFYVQIVLRIIFDGRYA